MAVENGRILTRAELKDAVNARCPGLAGGQFPGVFEAVLYEICEALAGGERLNLGLVRGSKRLRNAINSECEAEAQIGRHEENIAGAGDLTFTPSPLLVTKLSGAGHRS